MPITRAYASAAQPGNAFLAGKNKIINGDFGIWQRGTSLALSSSYVYLADRFKSTCRNGAGTQSRYSLTAAESAICANLKYAYSFDISTAATNTKPAITQFIEDSWDKYGKTFTVSFYAKASKAITMDIAADLIWANADNTASTSVSLTTTFQRFSFTFTLSPSGTYNSATDNLAMVWYTPMNDTYTVYMTGVQVESGSVATPFQTATGTLAGELAACQRYYVKMWGGGTPAYNSWGAGGTSDVTEAYIHMQYPVMMRTVPTLTTTGTASDYRIRANVAFVCTSVPTLFHPGILTTEVNLVVSGGGMTVGRAITLDANNNVNAYLAFSAEL